MQTFSPHENISTVQPLLAPQAIIQGYPLSTHAANFIAEARATAHTIMQGKDKRLLVVVGPCSIHDIDAALDYAQKMQQTAKTFRNELYLVMRTYFVKPRTRLGWKGLINDPKLDGSFDINEGIKRARRLLCDITALNIPTATEFLDTLLPQYMSDLITWSAIGARTTESQQHRELASGLAMPVGFKNTTDGNVQAAVDAVNTARHAHHFLTINREGMPAVMQTKGNAYTHIVLRGSENKTNYAKNDVNSAIRLLKDADLPPYLMVDCSHGNSHKDYRLQNKVIDSICTQLRMGNSGIKGVMLESNLVAGNQNLSTNQPILYGQSITDGCISWDETIEQFGKLAEAVKIL